MPATDAYVWNIKRMHVVFAASAIALMGVTFWMIGADHSEEWHDHQRTFERIQKLRLEKQRRQLQSDEFQKDIAQLEADVTKAQEKLESQSEEYEEALAELKKAQLDLSLKEKELKLQRAILGVARDPLDSPGKDPGMPVLDRLLPALLQRYIAHRSPSGAPGPQSIVSRLPQTAKTGREPLLVLEYRPF